MHVSYWQSGIPFFTQLRITIILGIRVCYLQKSFVDAMMCLRRKVLFNFLLYIKGKTCLKQHHLENIVTCVFWQKSASKDVQEEMQPIVQTNGDFEDVSKCKNRSKVNVFSVYLIKTKHFSSIHFLEVHVLQPFHHGTSTNFHGIFPEKTVILLPFITNMFR